MIDHPSKHIKHQNKLLMGHLLTSTRKHHMRLIIFFLTTQLTHALQSKAPGLPTSGHLKAVSPTTAG